MKLFSGRIDHCLKNSLAVLLLATLPACDYFSADNHAINGLQLSGTVEMRETDVAFRVTGRIEKLLVDEGDPVQVDQPLATLDDSNYQLALQQASAQVQAAQATLAVLRAGSRTQEIKAAQAEVDKALAQQRFTTADVKRVSRLVGSNLASEEALEKAQLSYEAALAGVESAQQRLALLKEGPRQQDIDRAAAQLAASEAAQRLAQQQLDDSRLLSPVDGMISVRLAEAGEVVGAGSPVLRIAATARPWVRAYLPESQLSQVKLGQAVEVRVDGLPDAVFPGRLSYISPKAEFTPKTVETRELRVDLVYRIKVTLDNPQGQLKQGMPADVSLQPAAS